MRKALTFAAVGIAALGSIGLASPSPAVAQEITAHAGGKGGLYMETLVVWSDIWNKKLEGVTVSPILGGSVSNALRVNAAKDPNKEIGVNDTYTSTEAVAGTGKFAERAADGLHNIRALYRFNAPSYGKVWIRKDALPEGVTTFGELLAKKPDLRWAFQERGNIAETTGSLMIGAYDVTYDDLKDWGGSVTFISFAGASELMVNGQADIILTGSRHPAAWLLDIDSSVDVVWLPLEPEAIAKLKKNSNDGMISVTEPADTYRSIKEPYKTVASDHIIIVHKDMDEELAYKLTKTALDNTEQMKNAVGAMKDFTPAEACNGTGAFELHPGAVRACKEAGAL